MLDHSPPPPPLLLGMGKYAPKLMTPDHPAPTPHSPIYPPPTNIPSGPPYPTPPGWEIFLLPSPFLLFFLLLLQP